MVAYLDSSVVLRHVLNGEKAIQHALACENIIASEILEIECRRVIHRYRLQNELDDITFIYAMERLDRVLAGMSLVKLSEPIKKRAMGAFPVIIKTLDALHIATALIYSERVPYEALLLFSHDDNMNRCARALGFSAPFMGEA